MKEKLFIGLGHKARQGKNYVADVLHAEYPHLTKVIEIPDCLKAYCRVVHGMTTKDAPLLQRVGQELRAKDEDVWIRAFYWTAMDCDADVILVPGVRFQNEADVIKRSGVMVKVSRLNADGSPYVATDRDPNHVSEVALDGYDEWDYRLIAEDGDKRGLRRQAFEMFHDVYTSWYASRDQRAGAADPV